MCQYRDAVCAQVGVCVCVGHLFCCVVRKESRDKSSNTQQNEELERQCVTSEKTKGSKGSMVTEMEG